MKKEEFLNFDGMPSEVPNDRPWSDTVWANQAGDYTEEQVVNVSSVYGSALNAAGESVTLDHYDDRLGPNMVLELPDSDSLGRMPDSDVWSNHPGFLGWTWSSKKREEERYQKELAKVNAAYPNSGSCAVLTGSLEKLEKSIANLEANKDKGGRGAKRVNARARKARKARKGSVASGQESACAGEEAAFQRQAEITQQYLTAPGTEEKKSAITPVGILLTAVLIGGVIWGVSRIGKPRIKAT